MRAVAAEWGLVSEVQASARPPAWVPRALLTTTLILVVFGLLSVYSASSALARQDGLPASHVLVNQAARALVGLVAMFTLAFFDYRRYRTLAWPILTVAAVLLTVLVLPWTHGVAPEWNGSRRWLVLGPVTFQPSEVAKIAVVIWTAALAAKKRDRLGSFRFGVLPFLIVLTPILLLVVVEPHLSATLITCGLIGLVLFTAGIRLRHIALLLVPAVPLLWLLVRSNSYQWQRLLAFLNPEAHMSGVGYQLSQAQIAIGSGGIFGVGFGRSTQKLHFLPEAQNDFIFPIIAEEWGLLGALFVLGAFLFWALLGFRIASAAGDLFGRLLAVGLTGIVAIGAFGHMGITMGVLPTTGVSLPFVSAGGTGLVTALGLTGVLLNIASKRRC